MQRRIYITAFVTGLLFVVGIAFAQWTVDGSGAGSAKAGVVTNLSISPGTTTTYLYPGGSADVGLTIDNPNPFEVTVTQIALDETGTITADEPHASAGCTPAVHGVTFSETNGAWLVAAEDSLDATLTGAASMAGTSPDECQDATFTIPLTASGVSGTALASDGCADDSYEDNDTAPGADLGTFEVSSGPREYWLRMCATDGVDVFSLTAQDTGCTTDQNYATAVTVGAPPDATLTDDLAAAGGVSVSSDLGSTIFWTGCTADFTATVNADSVPADGTWYTLTIDHEPAVF